MQVIHILFDFFHNFIDLLEAFLQGKDGSSCYSSVGACCTVMAWLPTSQTKISLMALFSFLITKGDIRWVQIWLGGQINRS